MREDDFASVAFISAGCLLFLAGIGIGLLQCYWYLQSGVWTEMSVLEAVWMFRGQSVSNDWWNYPQQWLGLHKILLQVPAGLAVFVAGFIPISIGSAS
ncbi:hypothetical protein [Pararhizobium sp. DWP1-1-3]|uniref:hypothetical protein n=1 Tax=Pararhizobium sp. DWP1-1-3 TaxID=2804652 RepID=UPI003CF95146